jgi:hypothetical protein
LEYPRLNFLAVPQAPLVLALLSGKYPQLLSRYVFAILGIPYQPNLV